MTNRTQTTPVARFVLGGREHAIEFTLEHLLVIERAAGRSAIELADHHIRRMAVRDADGEASTSPTQEQAGKALASVPVGEMRSLVAACIPMTEVDVPLAGVGLAYMALVGALSDAVAQVMGADQTEEERPQDRPTEASGS